MKRFVEFYEFDPSQNDIISRIFIIEGRNYDEIWFNAIYKAKEIQEDYILNKIVFNKILKTRKQAINWLNREIGEEWKESKSLCQNLEICYSTYNNNF